MASLTASVASSQPLTSRLATCVATGLVAAYGAWLLYTTITHETSQVAMASKGVPFWPQRERLVSWLEGRLPSSDSPLGSIVLVKDGLTAVIHLGLMPIPTIEELEIESGITLNQSQIQIVQRAAVHRTLLACDLAADDFDLRRRIYDVGLWSLISAIQDGGTIQELMRCSDDVQFVLGIGANVFESAIGSLARTQPLSSSRSHEEVDDGRSSIAGETEDLNARDGEEAQPSQGLRGLLYYIAEADANRKAYEHRGIHCEECGENPIRGVRYHCLNCPDFDLCSTCEPRTTHINSHVFVKVKIPLPIIASPTKAHPVWYPGDPDLSYIALEHTQRKELALQYGLDQTSIDALYEQFTCLANVPLPASQNPGHVAISRVCFVRAFTSELWPTRMSPRILHDRMFAFYDRDQNGLIDFREFLDGMSYLRGPSRYQPLTRALQGYDMDDDGYVSRTDFLRLIRAKFVLQKQLINDMIELEDAGHTSRANEVISSSQPISAAFRNEEIPRGRARPLRGKGPDPFGDMIPLPDVKTVLDDADAWELEDELFTHHVRTPGSTRETLEHHLSRFEEMLYANSHGDNRSQSTPSEQTRAPETSLNLEQLSRLGLDDESLGIDATFSADLAVRHDVLWEVVESSLNELLDSIFLVRETNDQYAVQSRAERQKWRTEIDAFKSEQKTLREDIAANADIDPLVATAAESLTDTGSDAIHVSRSPFVAEIVPTDDATLAQREEEIREQPLESLLMSTGYSVIDAEEPVAASSAENVPASRTRFVSHRTIPEHASAVADGDDLESLGSKETQVPDRSHLHFWIRLDEIDRNLKLRGGPGRLSYDDITRIADDDDSRKLRGMIVTWLEWASF